MPKSRAIYLPLWAQMTIISLVVSVLALLSVSLVVGVHTWSDGKQLAREKLLTVAGMYAGRLRDKVNAYVTENEYLSLQTAVLRSVEGYSNPNVSIALEDSYMKAVSKYARSTISSAAGYRALQIMDANYTQTYNFVLSDKTASLSAVLASLELLTPQVDPNFNASYFDTSNAFVIAPVLTIPPKGEPFFSMSISAVVYNDEGPEDYEVSGYVTFVIDTQQLVDDVTSDSDEFLADGDVDVVLLQQGDNPGFHYAASNHAMDDLSESGFLIPYKSYPAIGHMANYSAPHGSTVISKAWMTTRTPTRDKASVGCSRVTIFNTDWVVCAQTSRSAALCSVRSLRNKVIGLSFGMIGFILLMVIPTGRMMTSPLYSIYGQMQLPTDEDANDVGPASSEKPNQLRQPASSSFVPFKPRVKHRCLSWWTANRLTVRRLLWFIGVAPTPQMEETKPNQPIADDHKAESFQVPHKIEPLNRTVYCDELDRLVEEYNGLVTELNTQYYYLEDQVKARTMEAQEARIEAEKANLAKSQFIANITHELRTPLNGIMGMTSVTLSEESIPKIQVALGIILKSGRTLMKLLNELLAFSRSQIDMEATMSEFTPQEIFANLENMFNARPESEKKDLPLKFLYRCDPPVLINCQFMGDGHRISQICLHLFSNALKFSAAGDRITASIRYINEQRPNTNLTPYMAHITPSTNVGVMEIAILDSGQGIEASQLESIFEPFVQGDDAFSKKYGGTGLGMSMCKQLAGTIGASLGVWSSRGKGTCCILEVPVFVPRGTPVSGPLDLNRNGMFYTSTSAGTVTKFTQDPSTAKRMSILSMEESIDGSSISLRNGSASVVSGGVSTITAKSKENDTPHHQKKKSMVSSIFSGFLRGPHDHHIRTSSRHLKQPSASTHGTRIDAESACSPAHSSNENNSMSPGLASTPPAPIAKLWPRTSGTGPNLSPSSSFNDITGIRVPNDEINIFLKSLHPNYRVLVADDNALNLEIMVKMLKRVGIENVHTATDGEAVVKLVERSIKEGFHYSVIFMDLSMPRLDGFQATNIIRRTLAYPYPIVALTGYSDQRTKRMCDTSNIQEILVKPVLRDALIAVLAKYDS